MLVKEMPAGGLAATRQAGHGRASGDNAQPYCTLSEPCVLEVFKRGGWKRVAKLTYLDGGGHEPIIAIVHRNQRGTTSRVSLTLSTIRYAKDHGVRWFVFRRDTTGEMFRMLLSEVEKCDLGPSVGGLEAERYVSIAKMERVPWCDWKWADRVVRLEPLRSERSAATVQKEREGLQPSLFEVGL